MHGGVTGNASDRLPMSIAAIVSNSAYESQREQPHYRALHQAQAFHEKLGGTGITDGALYKPKGMHSPTYYRHLQRIQEAESRAVPPWLLSLL